MILHGMCVQTALPQKIKINSGFSGQRWGAVCLLVAMFFISPFSATASEEPGKGIFSMVFENDIFSNTDQYYTNGLRLSWLTSPDKTPEVLRKAFWFPWFSKSEGVRASYAIGQDIYTPKDLCSRNPPLDDHPYAGWLYGSVGLVSESGRRLDQLALTVGVVGPASLAEQMQNLFHDMVNTNEANGWETQLKNEPGIILAYRRSWRSLISNSIFGIPFDITPHAGGALGNVFTHANAGLMLRYGKNLPFDFGPPCIQPVLPGSGFFILRHHLSWYFFAGIDGRAVARNIFLDGNTFRDSRSVEKKPLVGALQFGVAIIWGRVRLGYTHLLQTREFESQSGRTQGFGAVSLSVQN